MSWKDSPIAGAEGKVIVVESGRQRGNKGKSPGPSKVGALVGEKVGEEVVGLPVGMDGNTH